MRLRNPFRSSRRSMFRTLGLSSVGLALGTGFLAALLTHRSAASEDSTGDDSTPRRQRRSRVPADTEVDRMESEGGGSRPQASA